MDKNEAFNIASGGDASVTFTPTQVDPTTGTEIEFKGSNGSTVAFDSSHSDMDAKLGHDKSHIGVQTGGGKRKNGGTKRYNLTYDGQPHPSRLDDKTKAKRIGCHT